MNYARFYLLLGRVSATDKEELKRQLVRQYTGGRTTSLKEMTFAEYNALCNALEQSSRGDNVREIYREQQRLKRSAVLRLMQQIGIDTTNWECVDAYCKNPRIAGKRFAALTNEELDAVAIKLRVIKRKERDKKNRQQLIN